MFDFFRRHKNGSEVTTEPTGFAPSNITPITPVNEADYSIPNRPHVNEDDFIDGTDPNDNPHMSVNTINYGTNMPIDSIFAYIEKDWEEQGRQDALRNPDAKYMDTKIEMIRETLKRRFEQVTLRYRKDIRNYESMLQNLQQMGLTNSKLQIEAHIDTCKEHLNKLNDMNQKLENNDASMTTMIDSYRRGFSMGVATAITNLVNQ